MVGKVLVVFGYHQPATRPRATMKPAMVASSAAMVRMVRMSALPIAG
jgi:hypothetical protein